MPVRKRVSSIFKKNDKSSEKVSDPPNRPYRAALSPAVSSIFDEDEDERNINAATHASLQEEVSRLEGHVREQTHQLSLHEETTSQTVQEINYLKDQLVSRDRQNASSLEELQISHSAQLTYLDTRLRESIQDLDLAQEASCRVQDEYSRLQEEHARLKEEHARLQQDKSRLQEEKSRAQGAETQLKDENTALQNDIRELHGLNQQYVEWVPKVETYQKQQQERIRHLEQQLVLALQPMDEETRRAFINNMQWAQEKQDLEAKFEAEKADLNHHLRTLTEEHCTKVEEHTKERSSLQSQVAALEADVLDHSQQTIKKVEEHDRERSLWQSRIESSQADLNDQKRETREAMDLIQGLELYQIGLQEEVNDLQSELEAAQARLSTLLANHYELFGPNPTPRQFLFVKMFARRFPRTPRNETTSSTFGQSFQAEDLTSDDLDIPLEGNSITNFVNSLTPGSAGHQAIQRLQFRRCPECKRHKIFGSRDEANRDLIEYPAIFRQTKCRTCDLCTSCLKEKLQKAITEGWWYELDSAQWLQCPVDGCDTPLGIGSIESIDEILRDFSGADVAALKTMYRCALAFRETLSRIDPRPNLEAISISISLHQQLTAYGLFQDQFNISVVHDEAAVEPFTAGGVLMGSVDRLNMKIPIFTKFFQRSETAADCSICLESIQEIEIGTPERWTQACEGYQGSWMSEIMSYPTREMLRCDHDMNVCKQCLRRHLESQLEQHGRNARGRMTCPICNRLLSDQEFSCLGSVETVQRYDHYLFLSYLSADPNYRSCLSPTCNSGQIYEQDEDYPNPHIACDECSFEMCFTHQMPWHSGQNCDQYDSQRQHGDPDFQETQNWMQSNSKNCPGCRVNIEKGNACFHMTCTQCRHEFCWECLGDWRRINPQPGTYVKEAHNAGCWFRDSDIEPTQISGTDLQQALRRRGRA